MLYIQTILVYAILAFCMYKGAYLSAQNTQLSKLWAWIPIIAFTLVFGLRYGVGIDYFNYEGIYEYLYHYDSLSEAIEDSKLEDGFLAIMYLCSNVLKLPAYGLFTIIAFLQIYLLYRTFKDEGNVLGYIYIVLILTSTCVGSFMNIMRQEIAICLFFYSLKYIIDDKPIQYWIICIVAFYFHHSAIILFPLYFLWIRRKSLFNNPTIELVILLLFFLSSLFTQWQSILHLFDNTISWIGYVDYLDRADKLVSGGDIGIMTIFTLLVNCLIVLNSKQLKAHYNSNLLNILYDLYFIGVCLSYLFMGSMLLGRIIAYFSHAGFILLGYTLYYLRQVRKQQTTYMVHYMVVIIFIVFSFGILIRDCRINTAAYVSVFQTELHTEKLNSYEDMIQKRE